MKTKAVLKLEIDLITGQTKVMTDGLEHLQAAVVLTQVAGQLIVQSTQGIIAAPQRPIGVHTSS